MRIATRTERGGARATLVALVAVVLLALMVRYLVRSRKKGRAAYRCVL